MAFIKLDRKYFDNFLWNEARVYSKAEAWLDLIQMARFEASTEFVNGKLIEVQRGEIPASRRFLELRWQWGSSKVSNFLKLLVSQGMITTKQTSGQTVISLCKYKDYNDVQTTKQTTDEPQANHRQTTDEPQANQIKEYKNKRIKEDSIKGEKQISPPPQKYSIPNSANQDLAKSKKGERKKVPQKKESIEDRAETFKKKVWLTAKGTEYNQEHELQKFWGYWSEHGENDRLMRCEKEKSFSIKRRLGTWFSNAEKFNRNGKEKHKQSDSKSAKREAKPLDYSERF